MLVRGTYKQIANAAWKIPEVNKELKSLMLKDLERETTALCSKSQPSILRRTDKQSMLTFSLEKVSEELKQRAPFFHSILSTSCTNRRSKNRPAEGNYPAVAMAASVCLRSRSRSMIATQLLITTFLYHSSWMSTLARLSALRLTTSHTYLYKKLDEFGKDHSRAIKNAMAKQGEYMAHQAQEKREMQSAVSKSCLSHAQDVGRKLTFDNLDYKHEVHYMTEENQNADKHCVTIMSTENRVSGDHLSSDQPDGGILEMENGKAIPDDMDNIRQHDNYVALVERIITSHIPYLQAFSDVATRHIPHRYWKEMTRKTDTTFLGIVHESENDADGILAVICRLHEYVPFHGNEEDRQYGDLGVVGDQLSMERGINGHMSLSNGFTPEQRAEGLHFEVADWHAGNRFLELAFSHLYKPASSADKCTMYSDRNLINRRNVKSDVAAAANACRRFFQLEVESRVVAAALNVLGMDSVDAEKPAKNAFNIDGEGLKDEKKSYINKLANLIVDCFVTDKKRNNSVEKSIKLMQDEYNRDGSGRYPCRFPGCKRTFAHPGKLRKDHEASHNPPISHDDTSAHVLKANTSSEKDDDMLAYQMALLDYGMLVMNFWDAISEGDGERLLRCWKFFLMYLKHEGSASKYAVEALYLMFQYYSLLSPQSAHRLIWNRFIKNKEGPAGNIPLDLQLEFYNKTVKQAIKNLGPAASHKSIDRICCSLRFTTDLMQNYDRDLCIFKRSGEHVKKSTSGDLQKIVKELVSNNAFQFTPGRKYQYFANMKPSILIGFDMCKMLLWINDHKKYMVLNRRAQ